MKSSYEKAFSISQETVDEWCEQNDDGNRLHDADDALGGVFGQPIVPGMLLLDQLSGLLTNFTDDSADTILVSLTAIRFREPTFVDETVRLTAELAKESKNTNTVHFEARASERDDTLLAHGSVQITDGERKT
jgi:acyl dehydratase